MPQREDHCRTYRYTAEGPITQFAAVVEGTADKQVKLPGGADAAKFVGIALHAAATGEEVTVAEPPSIVRCVSGAAIARGVDVSINGPAGKVKTAAPASGTNTFLVGQSKSASAADGEQVFVYLNPSVMQGA